MKRALLLIAALGSAGGCDPNAPADAGEETSPCLDGACLGELECLSDLCVAPEGETEGAVDPTGASGDGNGSGGGNDSGSSNDSSGDNDPSGGNDSSGDDDDPSGGNDSSGSDDDSGGNDPGGSCNIPTSTPCEGDGVRAALGLCNTDLDMSTQGADASIGVRVGLGETSTWDATEGSTFAVIGSGMVVDLDLETPAGDNNMSPTHCSDDMNDTDPGNTLPAPLDTTGVTGDCVETPGLIGTGDCSNTLAQQFGGGGSAFDYAAIRLEGTVPDGVRSVSYDYAFFTAEYPAYVDGTFNDMHVGWLESESWTGNIAFDGSGGPISVNSAFLDIRDDAANLDEFGGTCMRGHAGTQWLRATAPVSPGEEITLVLAAFDMGDGIIDSYAFLDNVTWSCDAVTHPTNTLVNE